MSASVYAEPRQVTDPEQCTFYHSMDVPGFGEVRGNFDLRPTIDAYLGPVEFTGKRVLEIGPASGFLTFEMERRGASVVAVELDESKPWDYVPYDSPLFEGWLAEQRRFMERMRNGFWFAHRHFGSRAKVHYGSAYHLPEALGRFDVATMAAVLLHNRDPLGIIANCARITDHTLLIVDQLDRQLEKVPDTVLKLVPSRDNRMVHTWWHLQTRTLRQFLGVLGFEVVHSGVHEQAFASIPGGETEPLAHFTIVAERR